MVGTHEFVENEKNRDVLIYVNGEFFSRDEAKISVFDSAFLVGMACGRASAYIMSI